MSDSNPGAANPALGPDADAAAGEGLELAQFAAGCFWSVELTYQRLPGVARTEVGYSQGHRHEPTYRDVCGGGTGHAEVVRVHYDPKACPYEVLLDVFWAKHNPTTLNRQVRSRRSLVVGGLGSHSSCAGGAAARVCRRAVVMAAATSSLASQEVQ
jgi:peptide-methionine (S)-S-oxide reductase